MDTSALPTKNNLMKIKEKLKLSSQGQELLEKKKIILEMEKEKKYDVNNIFNNAKKNKENTTSDNEGIIIYKKSFFQRLKEKIKYIIKNKRKEK